MNEDSECGYNGDMRHSVGIREFRDALSRWIEKVKRGDEVVVTDHGKPVARLGPYPGPPSGKRESEEECLARLVAEGRIVGGGVLKPHRPLVVPGARLDEAVLEDREEGP